MGSCTNKSEEKIKSMNFGRISGRSKKNILCHYAMRITETKSSCLSLRWPSVNFSLEKTKCIQEILPFENSRIYTFENLMRVWGNFHCQFSQFSSATAQENQEKLQSQCFIPSCSLLQNQFCCRAPLDNFYHK